MSLIVSVFIGFVVATTTTFCFGVIVGYYIGERKDKKVR